MEKELRIALPKKVFLRLYAALMVLAIFVFFGMVHATTPTPGHDWLRLGNGNWQVANTQTALRSFTFPDADATALAAKGAPLSNTIPYGNGSAFIATTTQGVGGQVLAVSGGVPTWIATTSAAFSVPGVLIGTQVLTSGTTYTPTAGTNIIIMRMVGGGGGGGGATGGSAALATSGGGGSGGYAEKLFSNILGAASYTIAIGAGGTAGIAANGTGGTGGATTFACPATCTGGALTVTANGGLGGISTGSGATAVAALGGAGGAISTNGDENQPGASGRYSLRLAGGVSGYGAKSMFGGGGASRNTAGAGANGGNYGSGGSGATSNSTTGFAGGAGSGGVIVIWEFK